MTSLKRPGAGEAAGARPATPPVCDALVLAFSEGVSLGVWEDGGTLEREWALYERIAPRVGRVVLVTWGGARDRAIAARLTGVVGGVRVVCNEAGAGEAEYLGAAAASILREIGSAARVVVKTNQMTGGEAALRMAAALRGAGKPVALVARGGYLWSQFAAREHGAESPEARRAAEREGRLCRAASVVVATTRQMGDDLAWRHGLSAGRVAVVPNYVVAGESDERPGDPAGHGRATGADTLEVLFAGRLEKQKRVDRLIEAVSLLPEPLRGRVRLTIVGRGSLEKPLRAFAEELGVEASFEGRLPHAALLARMRSCALYAQASEYEGHPKTVLEAMASGAPVLVVDEPGLRGVVAHGVSGLCVPPEPRAIAAGVEAVLRDPAWRCAMGAAAAAQVRSECGLERIATLELEVYQRAFAGAGGAGGGEEAAAPWRSAEVRWEPALLEAPRETAVETWERSLAAFARRLPAGRRAEFLAALDGPLYHMQGQAAVEAEGGLHPKHRVMRYHDFFVERIRPGERVIDLGCGVGALAASIAARARAEVTGMDWSEASLGRAGKLAAERGVSLSLIRGDITRDRAPGAFDVIVLSNVLEHIDGRAERLAMWREWYRARRILIRVPAFDREWRVPWKKELGVEWRLDVTHETEYTRAQLEQEAGEAGLRITELIARWGEYWAVCEPAEA